MKKLAFLPVLLALVMFSCSNNNTDDDDDDNNDDSFGLTTLNYVDCKLDGQALSIKSPTNGAGYVTSSTNLSPDENVSSTAVYGGGVKPNGTVNNSFEFNKGTLTWPGQTGYPSDIVFSTFFPKGTSGTFSVDAANGWEFKYTDGNGTLWSTSLGSGNQSGSNIKITDKAETDVFGDYYVNLKLEFNCTIYDGNGNSKVVTNGESVVGIQSM